MQQAPGPAAGDGPPGATVPGGGEAGPQAGSGPEHASDLAKPITVVASIFPLADLVAAVGGDDVVVTPLLPAGASPHTFEAAPTHARSLAQAELVVSVGGGLDPFVERLLSAAPPHAVHLELLPAVPQTVFAPGAGPAAAGAAAGGEPDPHIWLDPVLVRDGLLPALNGALSALRPSLAPRFGERAAAYAGELTALDTWIRQRLPGLEAKGLITVHRAWGHFGARYGLQTWAVENQPGQEPSPRWLMDLLAIASQRNIGTLFTEPQLAAHAVEALVLEFGGQVLTLDPLGGPDIVGFDSYLEMMRTNVLTIERGLR